MDQEHIVQPKQHICCNILYVNYRAKIHSCQVYNIEKFDFYKIIWLFKKSTTFLISVITLSSSIAGISFVLKLPTNL